MEIENFSFTYLFRWIVLSCESGMHIASFQDGTSALPDLEYAKGINKLVVMKFNTIYTTVLFVGP